LNQLLQCEVQFGEFRVGIMKWGVGEWGAFASCVSSLWCAPPLPGEHWPFCGALPGAGWRRRRPRLLALRPARRLPPASAAGPPPRRRQEETRPREGRGAEKL
jgi:hypothetical protein